MNVFILEMTLQRPKDTLVLVAADHRSAEAYVQGHKVGRLKEAILRVARFTQDPKVLSKSYIISTWFPKGNQISKVQHISPDML